MGEAVHCDPIRKTGVKVEPRCCTRFRMHMFVGMPVEVGNRPSSYRSLVQVEPVQPENEVETETYQDHP